MEATSDYWRPPFYLFEAHGLQPWLVNAKDVRHLPGRPKTDVLDAVWLCKVAERQRNLSTFLSQFVVAVVESASTGLLIQAVPGRSGGSGCLRTNLSGVAA